MTSDIHFVIVEDTIAEDIYTKALNNYLQNTCDNTEQCLQKAASNVINTKRRLDIVLSSLKSLGSSSSLGPSSSLDSYISKTRSDYRSLAEKGLDMDILASPVSYSSLNPDSLN